MWEWEWSWGAMVRRWNEVTPGFKSSAKEFGLGLKGAREPRKVFFFF